MLKLAVVPDWNPRYCFKNKLAIGSIRIKRNVAWCEVYASLKRSLSSMATKALSLVGKTATNL
jgi:hypothetical protein